MDLREYLFRHRISVKDFSERINYARAYISDIVNGGKKPGKKLAAIIEKATNGEVLAEELLKGQSNLSRQKEIE